MHTNMTGFERISKILAFFNALEKSCLSIGRVKLKQPVKEVLQISGPFNAEATFVQSTTTKIHLKTI